MAYIMQVCWQLARSILLACCVYGKKTPDDGQRNYPKHVEFYSKNKFEKLVHIDGFIVRIYDDARSPEHQMCTCIYCVFVLFRLCIFILICY